MDRQEFSRLAFERLASLSPKSIKIIDESEDALTFEIISNSFIGMSLLKRINIVSDLLLSDIQKVDFHVDFVTLTENEIKNGFDEQNNQSKISQKRNSGLAAQSSL